MAYRRYLLGKTSLVCKYLTESFLRIDSTAGIPSRRSSCSTSRPSSSPSTKAGRRRRRGGSGVWRRRRRTRATAAARPSVAAITEITETIATTTTTRCLSQYQEPILRVLIFQLLRQVSSRLERFMSEKKNFILKTRCAISCVVKFTTVAL
jgi:hypothetical protein